MDKPLHPDYVYIDSVELQQRIAVHKKTGWVFCSDRYDDGTFVSYSPSEIELIEKSGGILTMKEHRIKKFFKGTFTKWEKAMPESKSNDNNQVQGEQKPKAENLELDIF